MLRIDRTAQTLSALTNQTLTEVELSERYGLQELIVNSPEAFFEELGEELFLLGKELSPSANVGDRIDLLCADSEGRLVIVELKRGKNKLQMLQAISYAGMIADWTADDVLGLLDPARREALEEFLSVDTDLLNSSQRCLLVAEGYDLALLSAAEWLCGQYGVPVTCYRISLATDPSSTSEYLSCSIVYPPPELAAEAEARGRGRGWRTTGGAAKTWEAHFDRIENPVVRSFFERCLADGWEDRPRYGDVYIRSEGKRRFKAIATTKWARGVQFGRFDGDIAHWEAGLSDPDSITPFYKDRRIHFRLHTVGDLEYFAKSVTETLQTVSWLDLQDQEEESDDGE